MKKYVYRVTGHTKKNGQCQDWAVDIEADTRLDALARARAMWYDWKPNTHMFCLETERGEGLIDYEFWRPFEE